MNINKEKIKQFIHYIIHKCEGKPNFGKTVLLKLMYFSDFNNYELYETQITDETYIKRKWEPIPSHFDDICEELKNEEKIESKQVPVITHDRNWHYSLKEPDTLLLSKNELEVIDDVLDNLSNMTAAEISEYSHGDKPWRVAKFHETLDPEFVFYRNEKYSVRDYND
ncbi:MAG: SocA family protein [Methanobrevibacter sp.]|nr:SocA family protein [Candidatus Methanovirga aequatorialis]